MTTTATGIFCAAALTTFGLLGLALFGWWRKRSLGQPRFWVMTLFVLPLLATSPCHAITINATLRNPGETLAGYGTATSAPTNAVGGGTLQALMDTAVSFWESTFVDSFTLDIQYGWFPRSSSAATHILLTQGGVPHRETSATIAFDSDGSFIWFLDPTPATSTEYTTFTEFTADLGGGTMNVGREYTGGVGAAARFDLLSTGMHEVGHALGLSSANFAFVVERLDGDVDVAAPLPFAGAAIPLISASAHLDLPHAVMKSSRSSGVRRLASDADILANAQISQFTVPEPSSILLAALGLLGLACYGWRQRKAVA